MGFGFTAPVADLVEQVQSLVLAGGLPVVAHPRIGGAEVGQRVRFVGTVTGATRGRRPVRPGHLGPDIARLVLSWDGTP